MSLQHFLTLIWQHCPFLTLLQGFHAVLMSMFQRLKHCHEMFFVMAQTSCDQLTKAAQK